MESEEVLFRKEAAELDAELWFDLVFDETKDAVLRYIYVHIHDPACADDVFQDVYTSLFQRVSRRGARDIRNPTAFLLRTAKREIARCRRRERSRPTLPAEEAAELAAPGPPFEESVAARDELRLIQDAVRALPPLTYKVFVLHYFFDLPVAEIAAELGTTEDAVKSRLSRARSAVRRQAEVPHE